MDYIKNGKIFIWANTLILLFFLSMHSLVFASDKIDQICVKGLPEFGKSSFHGMVFQCGKNYRVLPGIADAPDLILDQSGQIIASCGGMPGPYGPLPISQLCQDKCAEKNLCEAVRK